MVLFGVGNSVVYCVCVTLFGFYIFVAALFSFVFVICLIVGLFDGLQTTWCFCCFVYFCLVAVLIWVCVYLRCWGKLFDAYWMRVCLFDFDFFGCLLCLVFVGG